MLWIRWGGEAGTEARQARSHESVTVTNEKDRDMCMLRGCDTQEWSDVWQLGPERHRSNCSAAVDARNRVVSQVLERHAVSRSASTHATRAHIAAILAASDARRALFPASTPSWRRRGEG